MQPGQFVDIPVDEVEDVFEEGNINLALAETDGDWINQALAGLDDTDVFGRNEPLNESNPDLPSTRGGFENPASQQYGQAGKVTSQARQFELPNLRFGAPNELDHLDFPSPVNLSEVFFSVNPPPGVLPPNIIVAPNISINDTTMNDYDISVFTISLSDAQTETITAAFNFPVDVQVVGGTGLTSFDAGNHTGVLSIPAGVTEVTLEFKLLATSTLEPGDQFNITIANDNLGLVPNFVKAIGTSNIPADEDSISLATPDLYWTALNEATSYNVTFIIDISGSMNKGIETGESRLDKAKDALVELIAQYEGAADNLNIHIIPFGSNDNNQGAFVYTATSVEDAIDFVMKQDDHSDDGLAVGMINPNTGEAIGRGTHYNDALYFARLVLEQDIVNEDLIGFTPKIYFLSDGRPNPGHEVFDNQNWPASWGPWQNFIDNTQSEVPDSFVNHIDVYGISLGLSPSIAAALQSVVDDPSDVYSLDDDFSSPAISENLMSKQPAYFQGNILDNDNGTPGQTSVVEVWFNVDDAAQYILDHDLSGFGATASSDNDQIIIPLPQNCDKVNFETPLGGYLSINHKGDFFYLPPDLATNGAEQFEYQIRDAHTQQVDSSHFNFNVIADTNQFHTLVGDAQDNTLSTHGLSGVVTMMGNEGNNTFVIDLSSPLPDNIVIHDLFSNPNNTLKFIDVVDSNLDSQLTLSDVFTDVQQADDNATLAFTLDNHGQNAMVYLDNPGEYSLVSLNHALSYIDQHVQIEML